eukprot:7042847-Pyramimonas_sp.AAC.1
MSLADSDWSFGFFHRTLIGPCGVFHRTLIGPCGVFHRSLIGPCGCPIVPGPGTAMIKAPANPVRVVDTTGAGDLFTGGFLSAYLEGLALE